MKGKKSLGYWQRDMLEQIAGTRQGAFHSLMDLRGKAKKYGGRYQASLLNAIDKHNGKHLRLIMDMLF